MRFVPHGLSTNGFVRQISRSVTHKMWLRIIDPDRFDNHMGGKLIIKLGGVPHDQPGSPVHYHGRKGFPPSRPIVGRIDAPYWSGGRQRLGVYDGILAAVPNRLELLLAPLTTQEAVSSARG